MRNSRIPPLGEQRRKVAYLDGLPPSLYFGDASRQAKINALAAHAFGRLRSKTQEELDTFCPLPSEYLIIQERRDLHET